MTRCMFLKRPRNAWSRTPHGVHVDERLNVRREIGSVARLLMHAQARLSDAAPRYGALQRIRHWNRVSTGAAHASFLLMNSQQTL